MNSENIVIGIYFKNGGKDSKLCSKNLYNYYINFLKKHKIKHKIYNKNNKLNFTKHKNRFIIINKRVYYDYFYNEIGIHKFIKNVKKNCKFYTSICEVKSFTFYIKNKLIKKKDLIIETYKSSGSGGQSVNKTNSAVRIKHIKTGIKVECQKERSQLQNKKHALKIINNLIIKGKKNIYTLCKKSNIVRIYNFTKNNINFKKCFKNK